MLNCVTTILSKNVRQTHQNCAQSCQYKSKIGICLLTTVHLYCFILCLFSCLKCELSSGIVHILFRDNLLSQFRNSKLQNHQGHRGHQRDPGYKTETPFFFVNFLCLKPEPCSVEREMGDEFQNQKVSETLIPPEFWWSMEVLSSFIHLYSLGMDR